MAQTNDRETQTFLALGDSYTIGEGVSKDRNWPNQLIYRLNSVGFALDPPTIIATTGWTTDELSGAISQGKFDSAYDLVSLLIGVNNQYRGYPIDQYRTEFVQLLARALAFAGTNKKRVFVVSIPDYGVTPFGKTKDPTKISEELEEYNRIAQQICLEMKIKFINITTVSRQAGGDPELTAPDHLHPSAKMYGLWVEAIFPVVKELLAN